MKLLSLVIILLPFVVWRGYYEGPKIFIFLLIGLGLSIYWIYKILFKREYFLVKKTDYYYLAWLSVLIISSIFGLHPYESIIGGSYRHQGILFFLTLWLVWKTVERFNTKKRDFLNKGIAITILVESVIALLQFIFGNVYFGKPLGTLGEVNALAGTIAIGSYYLFRYFPTGFIIFPLIVVLITGSKSGFISILPNLMVMFKNLNSNIQKNLLWILLSLGTIIISLVYLKPVLSPFENRQTIWKLGINEISTRPLLGFGAESGEVVYNNAFNKLNIPLNGLIIDRAHNLFLDITIWSGVVGLMAFIGFLVFRFKNLKNKYQKLCFLSFILYSIFQPLSIVHWLLLFLM